ncbi:Uncharacterized protein HZ326_0118 [Fusarium oxysporum f. sp. albedinis]|nr:Uncharacterized protein HZ326_0118 [Fusarium oxysporum f. sp. albedinis]
MSPPSSSRSISRAFAERRLMTILSPTTGPVTSIATALSLRSGGLISIHAKWLPPTSPTRRPEIELSIFREKMTASHYIINEFRGHLGDDCTRTKKWDHITEPYSFVFGTTQYIYSPHLVSTLKRLFQDTLKPRERTAHEIVNKLERNVVFLAWD